MAEASSTVMTWSPAPRPAADPATPRKAKGKERLPARPSTAAEPVVLDPRGDLFVTACGTDSLGGSNPVRFQVCSRALARASKVFDAMLFGSFAESAQPGDAGEWHIDLPDDAAVPMRQLFGVMHGRFQRTHHIDFSEPKAIRIVYDLLVVADKYDATGLLKPWEKDWLSNMTPTYDDQLELLWASWIYYQLGYVKKYAYVVTRLILDFPPDLKSEGVEAPAVLPPALLDTVVRSRVCMIDSLVNPMERLVSKLFCKRSGSIGYCSDKKAAQNAAMACEQLMLGRLLYDMNEHGIMNASLSQSRKSHSPTELARIHDRISGPAPKGAALSGHELCCISQHLQKYRIAAESQHQPSFIANYFYTLNFQEAIFMFKQQKVTGLNGTGSPNSD